MAKPIPLSDDEACTWLMFATIESAEVLDGALHLLRDDGARLVIRPHDGGLTAEMEFTAEGATT